MAATRLTIRSFPNPLRAGPDLIWSVDFDGSTTTAQTWEEALHRACTLGWLNHGRMCTDVQQRGRCCAAWAASVVRSIRREGTYV